MAFQVGDFGSLEEVLLWIIQGGGAAALVALFMAFILEVFPAWHNLPYWLKVSVPIVLAALVGAFAETILDLDLLAWIPDYVRAILLMIINWLVGQMGYLRAKRAGYATQAQLRAARAVNK
jgi:hypothetical protein